MADPIPLSAPNGRIYAYACGLCHQVRTAGEMLLSDGPSDESAERSRVQAEGCCRCRSCGVATGPYALNSACEPCAAAQKKQSEEREAKYQVMNKAHQEKLEERLSSCQNPEAAHALRSRMEDLSESFYCAGWLIGLEYTLWDMVLGGDRQLGVGEVPISTIDEMRRLSEACGGWWYWDDGNEETLCGQMWIPRAAWDVKWGEYSLRESMRQKEDEGGGA